MKRIFSSACFFLHLIIIAIVEFVIVVSITNFIVDKINYYGIGNVFILIAVGALWSITYVAFLKEIERRK